MSKHLSFHLVKRQNAEFWYSTTGVNMFGHILYSLILVFNCPSVFWHTFPEVNCFSNIIVTTIFTGEDINYVFSWTVQCSFYIEFIIYFMEIIVVGGDNLVASFLCWSNFCRVWQSNLFSMYPQYFESIAHWLLFLLDSFN